MVKIDGVALESRAQRAGILPGDMLESINGHPVGDVLDYRFYETERELTLSLRRGERAYTVELKKPQYASLGLEFASYLMDEQRACRNKCVFCFIDQLPKGMRPTLYFKDDDDRLSFLFGNYITLTNMSQREVDRIKTMHISPINVSVHTTDPALRVRMMANKRAGEVLRYLQEFADAGIALNCQLVLCRGINDGDALRRTLRDLTSMHPAVQSIAAVPSGLTAYRKGLYPLTPYDRESAAEVLEILEEAGRACKKAHGRRLVYPGDEWYLLAGRPIPPESFYEGYPQLENGVGMWRCYRERFLEALASARRRLPLRPRRMDLVTGEMAAPLISELAAAAQRRHPGVSLWVHPIRNDFFGGNVGVAGLITATDIIAQCRGRLHSRLLGIPENMLRAERDLFLDDISLAQLERALGVRAVILPSDGGDCLRALIGARE